jgi:glycosyltransferase involved in cell wall biosynthesis
MARVLYTVNIPRFFVTHRLPLALAAREAGHDVHVATSGADRDNVARIVAEGLPHHPLPLEQHGTSPLTEAATLAAIVRLYRRLAPDLVHHVSIKPVLYGGIAARVTRVPAVVAMMTGLGQLFVEGPEGPSALRRAVQPVLRAALAHPNARMVFQNDDDRRRFVDGGLIDAARTVLIAGSGVDVDRFVPTPERPGTPIVLYAGRLLWSKGLAAFVTAARALGDRARFVVVGYPEPSAPDAVPTDELERWRDEGAIEWWGRRDDMPEVLAGAHVVVLPSQHGEGLPKVLVEAAACARALVATDTPGCRDVCRDGRTGLIVPVGNDDALAAAIDRLLADPALRRTMGAAGRDLVEREFALDLVNARTLALYDELLASAGQTRRFE